MTEKRSWGFVLLSGYDIAGELKKEVLAHQDLIISDPHSEGRMRTRTILAQFDVLRASDR